jgi:hypothetical protein
VNLVGPAGVVLETLGGGRHLDLPRLEDRLAVVQRLEAGDVVGALHELFADLPDQAAAFARRELAPRPVERRPRSATAASTSACSADATSAITSSVAGSRPRGFCRRGIAPFGVDEELSCASLVVVIRYRTKFAASEQMQPRKHENTKKTHQLFVFVTSWSRAGYGIDIFCRETLSLLCFGFVVHSRPLKLVYAFRRLRYSFSRVVGLEQQLLQLALEREAVAEAHLEAGLDRALDAADGLAGLVRRRELLRVLLDRGRKVRYVPTRR